MLRALGFKKTDLIGVVAFKSLSFSVLGLCFGLVVATVANIYMKELIFLKAKNVLTYDLSTAAIVLGVLFGFFTPFFSNYWPIQTSMSKNLRDSDQKEDETSTEDPSLCAQLREGVINSITFAYH